MTIQNAAYHQANFKLTQAMGAKANAGNASLAPDGFESMYLLFKQFPHPILSGGQEIETAMAGGGMYYEQAPIMTSFQGPVSIYETEAGNARSLMTSIIAAGGFFDARVYEGGTPDRHVRSYRIERCFIKLDPPDRDWENKGQNLLLTGTISYNYFGVDAPGNI